MSKQKITEGEKMIETIIIIHSTSIFVSIFLKVLNILSLYDLFAKEGYKKEFSYPKISKNIINPYLEIYKELLISKSNISDLNNYKQEFLSSKFNSTIREFNEEDIVYYEKNPSSIRAIKIGYNYVQKIKKANYLEYSEGIIYFDNNKNVIKATDELQEYEDDYLKFKVTKTLNKYNDDISSLKDDYLDIEIVENEEDDIIYGRVLKKALRK